MKTIGTIENLAIGRESLSSLQQLDTGEIISILDNGDTLPVAGNVAELKTLYQENWEVRLLLDYAA